MREKLEKQLRSAAADFQKQPSGANLKQVQRLATLLQNLDPNRAQEVSQLVKKLLPLSTQPPSSVSTTKS